MKEICICAAIVTLEGTIIRGHRHDDCILTAIKMHLQPSRAADSQGFITSTNRFVTRREAMILQRTANLLGPSGTLQGEILFSEDLY